MANPLIPPGLPRDSLAVELRRVAQLTADAPIPSHSQSVMSGLLASLEEGSPTLPLADVMTCHPVLVRIVGQLLEALGVLSSPQFTTGTPPVDDLVELLRRIRTPPNGIAYQREPVVESDYVDRCLEAFGIIAPSPLSLAVPEGLTLEQTTAYYTLLALSRSDRRLSFVGLAQRDAFVVLFFGGLIKALADTTMAETPEPLQLWCSTVISVRELRTRLRRPVPREALEPGEPLLVPSTAATPDSR